MPFKKGVTNNPKGRPKKAHALTDSLMREFSRMVVMPDGSRVNGKIFLAQLVKTAVLTGRVRFPYDEKETVLAMKDWIDFVRWTYQYLEPPITAHEITGSESGPVVIRIIDDDERDTDTSS